MTSKTNFLRQHVLSYDWVAVVKFKDINAPMLHGCIEAAYFLNLRQAAKPFRIPLIQGQNESTSCSFFSPFEVPICCQVCEKTAMPLDFIEVSLRRTGIKTNEQVQRQKFYDKEAKNTKLVQQNFFYIVQVIFYTIIYETIG